MQPPPAPSTWRLIDWILVPICRPDCRRLVLWSFTLSLRLTLLRLLLSIVLPIATPGMLLLVRHWFEALRAEAAEFRRAVYAPRSRLVLQREADKARPKPAAAETISATACQNPWL